MKTEQVRGLTSLSDNLLAVAVVLVIVIGLTGAALSFWYVPSSQPLRTADGRGLTILTQSRIDSIGGFVDTLRATPQMPRTATARSSDIVPSQAQASIRVDVQNAPAGGIVRRIHAGASDVLLVVLVILCCLLVVEGRYARQPSTWQRLVVMTLLVLAGGWTGRILVDDVYAEISRRVMAHELSQSPFGSAVARLLGVESGGVRLARTAIVHVLLIGVLTLYFSLRGWRTLWDGINKPLTLGISAFGIAAGYAIGYADWGVRDAVQGLHGTEKVTPWWGIQPLRAWTQWIGTELTGYLVIAGVVAAMMLPLWYSRTSRRTVTVLCLALAGLLLMGLLFGN
ncbi:MAG: hypothetical protein FGM33_07695 [Candidatus Kapabacteria bacterium]|nr:hypothetical protein [Candidatus Kapabacteria bacterium]